jgi:hypothetical protein
MKKLFFPGFALFICLSFFFNCHAMNNLLHNINTLVSETTVQKTAIEIALNIRLTEDKEKSSPDVKIYRDAGITSLSEYTSIELRVFNNNTKYFLMITPDKPLSVSPEALKKQFSYKSFSPADEKRGEPAGYYFEQNGHQVIFYYDQEEKNIVMVSLSGAYK